MAGIDEHGLRILAVDDEAAIRRFLRVSLSAHGFTVFDATNALDALEAAAKLRPDMILLDLGLPDLDGIQVIRNLREWTRTPIIVLSVRDGEHDKIAALDAGADDYLVKPFHMGELLARMRVALRRALSPTGDGPQFVSIDLEVDLANRKVVKDRHKVELTPTEYDLLKVLIQNAGKVLTHQQLVKAVWNGEYADSAHLLRVNISNLRRKIETDPTRPDHILTEPGVGYRLRAER